MLNDWLALFNVLALPWLLGWVVTLVVCPGRLLKAARLALSLPIGWGVTSLVLFILGLFGVPFFYGPVFMLASSCGLLFLAFVRKPHPWLSKQISSPFPRWQKVLCVPLVVYLAYQIVYVATRSLTYPIIQYDEITVIGFKAKMFFYGGGFEHLRHMTLPSYPLMIPLDMLWTALNLGRWDDCLIKLIFPSLYVTFLVFQYYFLRRFNPFWALLGVALTVSANFFTFHATLAYQDFTMCVFNSITFMLMALCYRHKDVAYLKLAGVVAALGLFVKLEGSAFFVIDVVLAVFVLSALKEPVKEKIRQFGRFMVPGCFVLALYWGFVATQNYVPGEGRLAPLEAVAFTKRLGALVESYVVSLFIAGNWNMLWVLLIASFTAAGKAVRQDFEVRFFTLALGLCVGMCLAVDFWTHNNISHPDALSRVLLHFYPVVPTLIVLLNAQYFGGRRR